MTGPLRWPVLLLLLVVALLAGAALGCGDDDDEADGLDVVTSLPLFAEMVENVAGDRVQTEALLSAGADPHTFEPTPGDVRKVAEADVIFANGLDLEPSVLNVIDANISDDAVLVELAEAAIDAGAEPLEDHVDEDDHEGEDEHENEEDHQHEGGDPHLWMDPANGRLYAAVIRDTLSEADPDGAATYSANYDAYAATLDETSQYMRDTTGSVPAEDRLIIATHDAFGYLARAIDFEVAGFVVPGPGQDASPEHIADLVTRIGDLGIPAVFTEPQTSVETRTLEQIAAEAGVEVCRLYSGALDDEVSTYVALLRFDAEELARCLGGEVGGEGA